jgi:FkbM family methyltransferase
MRSLYELPFRQARGESYFFRRGLGQVAGLRAWRDFRRSSRMAPNEVFTVRVGGDVGTVELRAGTADLLVFEQLFLHRELDFQVRFEPEFIIDAGANIGLATRYMAARWPGARIVALEVDAGNFRMLQRNTRHLKNVTPVFGALWGTDGYVRINNPDESAWAFTVETCSSDAPGAVPAYSVGDLMRRYDAARVDILKCDIEGSEADVLTARDLGWLGATRVLAVELHDRFRPGCSDALQNALRGRDHSAAKVGEYDVITFAGV